MGLLTLKTSYADVPLFFLSLNFLYLLTTGFSHLKNIQNGANEKKTMFYTLQKSEFNPNILRNSSSTQHDEAAETSNCIMNSKTNGDPLVFVPLSILKSLMKTNTVYALSHDTSRWTSVQNNSNPHESIQSNSSTNIIMKPTEDKEKSQWTTMSSNGTMIQTPPNNMLDEVTNSQKNLTASKNMKEPTTGRIKSRNKQLEKLKSTKINRKHVGVPSPFLKKQEEKEKLTKSYKNPVRFCKVCGDKESSYVHYGGNSCKSCRAFFRRAVEKLTRYLEFNIFCVSMYSLYGIFIATFNSFYHFYIKGNLVLSILANVLPGASKRNMPSAQLANPQGFPVSTAGSCDVEQ